MLSQSYGWNKVKQKAYVATSEQGKDRLEGKHAPLDGILVVLASTAWEHSLHHSNQQVWPEMQNPHPIL